MRWVDDGPELGGAEHAEVTHRERAIGEVLRPQVAKLLYYLASSRAAWITVASYSIDGARGETCPL